MGHSHKWFFVWLVVLDLGLEQGLSSFTGVIALLFTALLLLPDAESTDSNENDNDTTNDEWKWAWSSVFTISISICWDDHCFWCWADPFGFSNNSSFLSTFSCEWPFFLSFIKSGLFSDILYFLLLICIIGIVSASILDGPWSLFFVQLVDPVNWCCYFIIGNSLSSWCWSIFCGEFNTHKLCFICGIHCWLWFGRAYSCFIC